MSLDNQLRNLIARRRNGKDLPIDPDLDRKLPEIISNLKAGTDLNTFIKYDVEGMGRFLAPQSTWHKLIAELIDHFERVPERRDVWRESLLVVLETLALDDDPRSCWLRLRQVILDRIDSLSGWNHADSVRRLGDIERRGDRYYRVRDGEEMEVLGARTLEETRWDFIFNDARRQYGLLRSVLRIAALRNACVDFRAHPEHYPKTIRLRLSEDQNGHTWFLYWRWEIPWPYERKYLPWSPECQHCNVDYLVDDLLAWFADREHLPSRDTSSVDLYDNEKVFEEKTRNFPWQSEIALETELILGEGPEVWFEFRGHPLRWINRTAHVLATLVVPARSLTNNSQAYRLALGFLSALVYREGRAIRIVTSAGGGRRRLPILRQPHQFGGLGLPTVPALAEDYAEGSPKALAISLYAEAVNSGSVYYSFLSYYKVIELAHSGRGERISQWINENLERVRPNRHPERIAQLRQTENDVAKYLYSSSRCAVAHATRAPIADPDNPEDRSRLTLDVPIVQSLARKAIEDGLFNEEPPSVTAPSVRGGQ